MINKKSCCKGLVRRVTLLTLVFALACASGCSFFRNNKAIPNSVYATAAPLKLPVDDDTFWFFVSDLRAITSPMAAERKLSSSRPDYFQYQMPDTLDSDSDDPAVRYLSKKLEESRALGYDFSVLTGKKIAGCVMVYADMGKSHAYIGLCGENGKIAGLWEDDFLKPDDSAMAEDHWSVLGLETKELKTTVVDTNPGR